MQISKIPFNMKFSENTELKEVPENTEQMKEGINFLLDELDKDIVPVEQAGIQSLLGVFSMMVGSLDEALFYLEEADKIYISEGKIALAFIARIRTAVVLMSMEKFEKSYKILSACLKKSRNSKNKNIRSLQDRIYIDLGKLKFFQKEYESSLGFFVSAMELRVATGDIEKIEHIKHFLKIVDNKLVNK